MAKRTLAFDSNARQFRTDILGRRFYLGSNASDAEERKGRIARYRATLPDWTPEGIEIAKRIAKGEKYHVPTTGDDYQDEADRQRLARQGVPVAPVATMEDYHAAEAEILRQRVAELEAQLREIAGPRVAEGSTVTVAEVFREWHKYRKQTAVYPGTSEPTDAVKGEGRICEFIIRQLPDADLKLAHLDYAAIDVLCKRIAARPVSIKTGKPVSRPWAKESLKIVRRVIRWAGRTYGYRRPEEWEEATKGQVRWIKEDQLRRQRMAELIYTPEELRTLYRYALPSERVCLLLALNAGFRQREVTALQPEEIKGDRIARYRDKSDIYAEWTLWPETVAAMEAGERPKKRSKVTRAWERLLDRVCKDIPTFRRLSFKRLCKTGASAIRRIAGGEVASLYVSHGSTTTDDLLESYAAADWTKLHDALSVWRQQELDLENVAAPVTTGRTAAPLSKIELCKQLWATGSRVEEIVRQTGLSRATCYRYR